MNTITRHWLNPDIQWYQFDSNGQRVAFGFEEIAQGIDHWKNILVEHAEFVAGQRLGVGANLCDIRYLCLVFAGLELGARLVVIDKPVSPDRVNEVRCRIHAPFHVMAYNTDNVDSGLQAILDTYAVKLIDFDLWFGNNFASADHLGKDQYWATPDSELLVCTSSGSTGVPTPITYTHEFFSALLPRQQNIFKFEPEDRVLHLSNFHHGGSSANFFFPTVGYCRHHYFDYGVSNEKLVDIIDLVQRERINKIMFPNGAVLDQFMHEAPRFSVPVDIHCLQANRTNWIPLMKAANIRSVTSHWGFSEMEGPILLNVMTADSPESFDVLNFGQPLDDFYQLSIVEDGLSVVNQYRGQYTTKDSFTQDADGNYIFHGRKSNVRINDTVLEFEFFNDLAKKYFEHNQAFLVPDSELDLIYLLHDRTLGNIDDKIAGINQELAEVSPDLKINFVDSVNIIDFFDMVKFSNLRAKSHCRHIFNL